MAVRRWTRVATAAVLVFLAVAVTQSTAASESNRRVVGLEREVLEAVNDVRAARGLRALTVSPGLRVAALAHSRSMVEYGFFAHDSADGSSFAERLRRAYPPRANGTWTVGENLYSSSIEPTGADAVTAWLASPPHRGILLSPLFTEIGIGIVRSPLAAGAFGNQPTWVVTADFGSRTGRATAGRR